MSIKFVRYAFNGFKTPPKKKVFNKDNPYINYHKSKMQNDANYDEYLEWSVKNGYGVPVEKQLSLEDRNAEKKIKSLL